MSHMYSNPLDCDAYELKSGSSQPLSGLDSLTLNFNREADSISIVELLRAMLTG
jgi:hypothetical protein